MTQKTYQHVVNKRKSLFFLVLIMMFSTVSNFFTTQVFASSDQIKKEKVTFTSGSGEYKETLNGTVLIPNQSGPRPAIVLVHGSGEGKQEKLKKEADVFVKAGFITLIYDKRTKGYSKTKRSYSLLAKDALAAVSLLQSRSDVNRKKVGLWGLSEGGWVAPLAASKSDQVAFVITIGGAGIKPIQQQTWYLENRMDHQGVKSQSMIQSVIRNGAGFAISAGMFPEANYDPIPVLKNLKQPLLALWGSKDRLVPPLESSLVMNKYLKSNGDHPYTLQFIEGADHGGYNNDDDGFNSLDTLAPGYKAAMTSWLKQVIQGNPPHSQIMGQAPQQERSAPIDVTELYWYDSFGLHLGMIIIFLITFIGYYLAGLFRKTKGTVVIPASIRRFAPALAFTGLISTLGFTMFLLSIWMNGGKNVGLVISGQPLYWFLIQLFAVTTCVLILLLAISWWKARQALGGTHRIRLTLLLIGGVLFIPWALYWQLLNLFL